MNRIYCSVRRAPVAEDIPDDPVVALLREEGDGRLPFMRPARATRPIPVAPAAAPGRQRLAVRGDLRRRLAGPGQLPPRLEPVVRLLPGAQMRRPERVRLVLRPVGGEPGRPEGRQPHGVAPRAEDGPPRQAPPPVGPARRPARHPENAVYQESQTRPAGLRGHGGRVHAGGNGALGGDSITH